MLMKALASSGLPATRLVVRVTEACLADDEPARLAVLRVLKAGGIAVTLVDFGAGASSLKRLMAFSFDHIVIEETFVADITRRADCATIVSALTGFASSLGIATIAEDVSAPEQFELLRAAGCGQFRGSLFGPSRTAADLAAMSRETKVA
jgi:EAL domain-containing protein (putative c-di-GMP-specific phosphodiesterase class I)